jgi:hypothetical protein
MLIKAPPAHCKQAKQTVHALTTQYSVLTTHYSMLNTQYSLLNTQVKIQIQALHLLAAYIASSAPVAYCNDALLTALRPRRKRISAQIIIEFVPFKEYCTLRQMCILNGNGLGHPKFVDLLSHAESF